MRIFQSKTIVTATIEVRITIRDRGRGVDDGRVEVADTGAADVGGPTEFYRISIGDVVF